MANDQSDAVELLETYKIDFEEIIQRLRNGESIFIKNKKLEILEPYRGTNQEMSDSIFFHHF